jgi:hypothetical protein
MPDRQHTDRESKGENENKSRYKGVNKEGPEGGYLFVRKYPLFCSTLHTSI